LVGSSLVNLTYIDAPAVRKISPLTIRPRSR
jgi:hypothetical protein